MQLTITIFSYATLYNQNNIIYLAFPFALFILLKMTSQYLLYRPVKYKDDGRDIVSFLDFVTIHVTFPSINAWISYQLYYSVALTSTVVCKTSFIDQNWLNFCEGESDDDNTFFYKKMMVPSIFAFMLLFVEASINLTYYKDCVFGIVTLFMFVGILWVNEE